MLADAADKSCCFSHLLLGNQLHFSPFNHPLFLTIIIGRKIRLLQVVGRNGCVPLCRFCGLEVFVKKNSTFYHLFFIVPILLLLLEVFVIVFSTSYRFNADRNVLKKGKFQCDDLRYSSYNSFNFYHFSDDLNK